MKVLNISSAYSKQEVYSNLARGLSRTGTIEQNIYVPVRTEGELGKNDITGSAVNVSYSYILTPKDRLLYHNKVKKLLKDVDNRFKVSDQDIVHAHFLFSDGGVAYELWKRYNIPFIVAVRNTDVNKFFKYAIHLRAYGLNILRAASKIILISHAYKAQLLSYVPAKAQSSIEAKIEVIPNAVHTYWIKNKAQRKNVSRDALKLLYVGDFSANKNVPFLIKFKQEYFPNATINIVGSTGGDEEEIERLAAEDDKVILHGRITQKEVLKHHYRDADILCILSKRETFGMAYIEALSQGTPIVYTQGQGVDGYFDKPVGEAVPYGSKSMLKAALERIVHNYNEYSANSIDAVEAFSGNIISNQYIRIYEQFGSKN